MKVIRGDFKLDAECVLTVGKFEGIHLGHQALIKKVVERAKTKGFASAVMVFEPHPFRVLFDAGYKTLFTESERIHILSEFNPDYCVTCDFDKNFAALSPSEFCDFIFGELKAREVFIGADYRFGKNREGTVDFLVNEAKLVGGSVSVLPCIETAGSNIISTSEIRRLVSAGDLREAGDLLGFPFFIMGHVTKGRQLGRTLGFPTLNLYPPDTKLLPTDGVYSTYTVIEGARYEGITNIGVRPTVLGDGAVSARSVETHLLDGSFERLAASDSELYGLPIKVELLNFIRPERKFGSLDELKEQIKIDVRSVRFW